MNILFLGGTGNISTACAARLRDNGHRVLILTRGHVPPPKGCVHIQADCQDRDAMRRALHGLTIDVAITFLGFEPAHVRQDAELFAGRVGQYIFISSTTVYAKPHTALPLTEESPVGNTFSTYAANKLACEHWLAAEALGRGMPWTIVRPSHTYSPHWIPNPVSSADYTMAARLEAGKPVFVHGDGQGLWTLTAASDFAVGLAGLVGNHAALGETFHITSDEVLTWNQIHAEIARALGIAAPRIERVPTEFICEIAPVMTAKLRGDKAEPGVFDNAKIKRFVPDFQCRKSFRDGIAEAVAWFRAAPARRGVNPDTDAIFETVTAAWAERRTRP